MIVSCVFLLSHPIVNGGGKISTLQPTGNKMIDTLSSVHP